MVNRGQPIITFSVSCVSCRRYRWTKTSFKINRLYMDVSRHLWPVHTARGGATPLSSCIVSGGVNWPLELSTSECDRPGLTKV